MLGFFCTLNRELKQFSSLRKLKSQGFLFLKYLLYLASSSYFAGKIFMKIYSIKEFVSFPPSSKVHFELVRQKF